MVRVVGTTRKRRTTQKEKEERIKRENKEKKKSKLKVTTTKAKPYIPKNVIYLIKEDKTKYIRIPVLYETITKNKTPKVNEQNENEIG